MRCPKLKYIFLKFKSLRFWMFDQQCDSIKAFALASPNNKMLKIVYTFDIALSKPGQLIHYLYYKVISHILFPRVIIDQLCDSMKAFTLASLNKKMIHF